MSATYYWTFFALVCSSAILSGCAMKMPSVSPSMLEGTPLRPLQYKPYPGEPQDVGPRLNGYGQATVPKDGSIFVQGDDTAYGADPVGGAPGINGSNVIRTKKPFTDTLSHYLNVPVVNRGYPSDTIAKGAARWAGQSVGNLIVIAYGFSDVLAKTPIKDFQASLSAMIGHAQSQGAAVILIVPPTYVDALLSQAEEPYRAAIRNAAVANGANVLELQAAITSLPATQPNILSDPDSSHPTKVERPFIPAPPNPFAMGVSPRQKKANDDCALFTRVADMLAIEVAVVR